MLLARVSQTSVKEFLTPDSISVQQDSFNSFAASILTANDPLGYVVTGVHSAYGGSVILDSGTITFTPSVKTGQSAGFKYTATRGTQTLVGTVAVDVTPLPMAEVLLYASSSEANAARSSYTPPSLATVFSTWDRTSNNLYYAGGAGASGDASAWQLLSNPYRVQCTLNTASHVCFASPETYSDYVFETIVSSSAVDDDQIGILVAFKNEGGVNYRLTASRVPGGVAHRNNGSAVGVWNWGLQFFGAEATGPTLALPSKLVGANGNWSVRGFCRLRVERQGNKIFASCSQWYASLGAVPATTDPASMLTIDLADWPSMSMLMNEAKYGYEAFSQQYATFQSTKFFGGINTTQIFDAQTGQVYEYNFNTSAWVLMSGQTIQSQLGWPRLAVNPETGVQFQINEDSIVVL